MTAPDGRPPPWSPRPGPELTPDAVVDAVVSSLCGHAAPDVAVAVVYAFASPRMRAAVGDELAFQRAFRNTLYAPLLACHASRRGPAEVREGAARAGLEVTTRDGERARYTLALARASHGDRKGCWLLSGIVRDGVDL